MPSEKEIEEAINAADNWENNHRKASRSIAFMHTLRGAYLSMKAERDKLQAIVDADTEALKWAKSDMESRECEENRGVPFCKCCLTGPIDKALAMRDKE